MNTKETTNELLCEMYRNVTMGSENLASVVPMIRDKFLMTNVTAQLEKYAEFTNKTEDVLSSHSLKPKKASAMKKAMARGGIMLNTLFDSSDSHIAEMIERGTRMGVNQLEQKMIDLESRGCDDETLSLCRDIISFERTESDRIKDYM